MSTETPPSEKYKPGWRSILLGLFVLGQIVFMPLANLMQLVPREMPSQTGEFDIRIQREGRASDIRFLQNGINNFGTAIDRYGELSGQAQAWSLFAPEFGTQSVYPVVECYCAEGLQLTRVTLTPKIIPDDSRHYFRWPGPYSRVFGYEFLLAAVYWQYGDESFAKRGEEWRQAVLERVRQQQKSLEAYFRWNLHMLETSEPDLPRPREMILFVRIVPAPAPGQTERPPSKLVPLARWLPARDPNTIFLPIEAYDPIAKQFVRLPVVEGTP